MLSKYLQNIFYPKSYSAFISNNNIVDYNTNREKYANRKKPSKSFLQAIAAIEEVISGANDQVILKKQN